MIYLYIFVLLPHMLATLPQAAVNGISCSGCGAVFLDTALRCSRCDSDDAL